MKIISGGQTGSDQAGLYAARDKGIKTGGYAPAKYMTLDGSNYKLKEFGLIEMQGGYRLRTYTNVLASDCTLRFAYDFKSSGEKCTLNAIKQSYKPYKDINLTFPITSDIIRDISEWIIENRFEVINIAGNTQGKYDVYTPVYKAVCEIIDYVSEVNLCQEKQPYKE